MSKRVLLVTITALVVVGLVLFLLPIRYTITVNNARYYGICNNSPSSSQCAEVELPIIIEKNEFLIRAWWNKTDIERQFTNQEVSVDWSDTATTRLGRQLLVIMPVLVILVQLLLVVAIIYVFVRSLMGAFRLKGWRKIVWLIVIILLFPIGSVLFVLINQLNMKTI